MLNKRRAIQSNTVHRYVDAFTHVNVLRLVIVGMVLKGQSTTRKRVERVEMEVNEEIRT